jgi:hypothetical protein
MATYTALFPIANRSAGPFPQVSRIPPGTKDRRIGSS